MLRGGVVMSIFTELYISTIMGEHDIKLIPMKEVPNFSNQIHLNDTYTALENFISFIKDEKKTNVFYHIEHFDKEKFYITEYDVISYLEDKYKLGLTEEDRLYQIIMECVERSNMRLDLHDSYEEEVSYTLVFVKNGVQYTLTFQEQWYEKLLTIYKPLEEIVDRFVKEFSFLIEVEDEKE